MKKKIAITLSSVLFGLCSLAAAARPPTDPQGRDDAGADPVLSSLSPTTVPRSDRVRLHGSGFGAAQGASGVRIGDLFAPITEWSPTEITAYVPKGAATGTASVQVVTNDGASNTLPLQVTQPALTPGRVSWRFRADALYIMGRPAVGADGTIYAADIGGHLYALDPDGGLKWIFNAIPGHVVGSVDVGPDGTIYFASLNRVYAVNPFGKQIWTVADAAGGGIFFGPNVGPDGNIYAVSDDVGGGLGAFGISPAGAVVWSSPGFVRFGHTGRNREIRFDDSQLYFNANNVDITSGLRGFSFDGELRFTVAGSGQPAVAPNGIVWTPGGALKGFFADGSPFVQIDGTGPSAWPVTGPDSSVYFSSGISGWRAINPDGSFRWAVTSPGRLMQDMEVAPGNRVIVATEYEIAGFGFVRGLRPLDGSPRWSIQLPAENGGWVRGLSKPRFSRDGTTVYIGMDVNDSVPDPYTYLYAIKTGPGLRPEIP
jgi:outer membrane protein assembly factor BamB